MELMFPNLKVISLAKCRKCDCLPPLDQIRSLEWLMLMDMNVLRCIEGNGIADIRQAERFPSLKQLWLERIPNLESWNMGGEENLGLISLPCLVQLVIRDCPRLRNIPLLPSIVSLEMEGCSEKSLHPLLIQLHASKIYYLKIKRCDDPVSLPGLQGLTQLQRLTIRECPSLIHLSDDGLGCLTSLTKLKIIELPKLVSLPQWVQHATKLQILRICNCEGLIHLPDSFGQFESLRQLSIINCHKLQSLPDGIQQLAALKALYISSDSLINWPNGLGNLTSLEILGIASSNMPYLPEQLHQLTSLGSLYRAYCPNLQLPEYIKNFTLLQDLCVVGCQNLQCLPEWMSRLTALKILEISYCEKLTSRCKRDIGEDWHKIAQIPKIVLNGESIPGN